MDIESAIDNIEQNEENTFYNPYTGNRESIYRIYDSVQAIVKSKLNGEKTFSYTEIEDTLLSANSNIKSNDLKTYITTNIKDNIIDKDINLREEAITYLSNQGISKSHLEVIRAGDDPFAISQFSAEDFETFQYYYMHNLSIERRKQLLENAQNLTIAQKNVLLEDIISAYIYEDFDVSPLTSTLANIGHDVSDIACNYLDETIRFLVEDEGLGSLSSIAYAKEDGNYDESMMDEYRMNAQRIADVVTVFSDLGFAPNQTCKDGRTLNEVITDSGDFKIEDIQLNYPIQKEDTPCVSLPKEINIKNIFNGCDIAHIIWRLEKADSKKNKNNVNYIWGEEVGDCNIMLMTKKVGDDNYTHFRVKNRSGAEKEIFAKPSQLIYLISK